MADKPTYEELEQRVKKLEGEISKRKTTEDGILESRDVYRAVFENIRDAVFIRPILNNGEPGSFEKVNPSACRILGYSAEELAVMSSWELNDPDLSADYIPEAIRRIQKEGSAFLEAIQVNKNGSKTPVEVTSVKVEFAKKPYIITVVRDISEYKRAENDVREREQNFRALADNAYDGIVIVTADGRHVYANQRAAEITGYSVAELLEMNARWLAHPDEVSLIADRVRRRLREEELSNPTQTVMITKAGVAVQVELSGSRTIWKGQFADLIIIRDITERKREEEAIRESKQFLDAIFDSIQDGISVLDSELSIVRVNQTMREWYAHMLPLEGKKCYEAYHGRTKACKICPTLRALDSGRLEMDEVPLAQAEGVTGTLELFSFPMLDDSGKPTGIVEYVRDITKRKRAEEALKESAEKIKLFAYSVAHDIKNPVIGIHLLTEHLTKNYKDILDEKGKNCCVQIMKGSEELATLVERINLKTAVEMNSFSCNML